MNVAVNSPKAWLLAARPKTLTGAITPVAVALALAWHDNAAGFQWMPAILCLLFAGLMQIDANMVNDYFDCLKGIDTEDRLGPERACQQGWITMPAMRTGLIIVTLLSALVGLPLVWWGGWEMLIVGAACIVFCYLYTTLLSGKAMGDILVLVFFGLVPVCVTYYILTGTISEPCILAATGCGLAIDNLLIVNNYRDRDTDRQHGKTTLVTIIGGKASLWLYFALTLAAFALAALAIKECQADNTMAEFYLIPYISVALRCQTFINKIQHGRALNKALAMTSLSILLYGIGLVLGVLL